MFPLGRIVATPNALEVIRNHDIDISLLISRHLNCDWSDMSKEDQKANLAAIHNDERIFGSYVINGQKIWAITEHNREFTTILLPEDY